MHGYFCLVLHAHLPFVRHPEHERFLEENWLFEAITESYLPLLRILEGWEKDALPARLALTLSPTLCAMLRDPLLRQRYARHLDDLIELVGKEVHRTLWEKPFHDLAYFYHARFLDLRAAWNAHEGDLVRAFGRLQDAGRLEIITSAATHAVLPLLARHSPSLRAQIRIACDDYRRCFGRAPRGIWLPECAYREGIETFLAEANLRWFITDTHGLLNANPKPRYAMFAPVFTPAGVAAFGRDHDSARQVWSRQEGYPGDPRYRDFYRDIGFDLDLDYLRPHLPAGEQRSFTGIKYHRVTGPGPGKAVYERGPALAAANEHATHFFRERAAQCQRLELILNRPPVIVSPYDAELFGHWWFEGPEFLDRFVRLACAEPRTFHLVTPEDYLRSFPTQQAAVPAASSWGEEGHLRVWLNEQNHWIYAHLHEAQERMTELARRFGQVDGLSGRALRQAGRELLLAQASDWPFILRTGTSPEYARRRLLDHLARFRELDQRLSEGTIDEPRLASMESQDNLFPEVQPAYWS